MTNREVLIEMLSRKEYETDVIATSYIECPYSSDSDCHNKYSYGTTDFQIYCDEDCKTAWLEEEYSG